MDDSIKRYKQRRDARLKKRMDDDWITMNGAHILVDDEGKGKSGAGGKFNGKEIGKRKESASESTSTGVAEKVKSMSFRDKMEYFKNSEPVNTHGASDNAVNVVKEMFKTLGVTPTLGLTEVEKGDTKLKKEIQKLAEENGIDILEWKTKTKKKSRLLGYSPIKGGGAVTRDTEDKVWSLKFRPMRGEE